MGFIEASMAEQGETATLLLAMAQEAGLHPWAVRTVPGGFEVPDSISSQLEAPRLINEGKTPPSWWSEPLAPVDVEFEPDGTVTLNAEARAAMVDAIVNPVARAVQADIVQEAPREVMRAWAKANGHDVADQGKLKLAVIEAYYLAHPVEQS